MASQYSNTVVHGFKLGTSTSDLLSTNLKPKSTSKNTSTPTSEGVASKSTIEEEEEDNDDDDWEDENDEKSDFLGEDDNDESDSLRGAEHRLTFQRVDSNPDLTSRQSLLTTLLQQGDGALVLPNPTSQSSSAIHHSHKTTPNGPSTGSSPQEDSGLMVHPPASHPEPIIVTPSNVHPPAMSPKTTRRTMLTTELSGSLRENLLLEGQQENATVNFPALRRAMTTGDVKSLNTNEQQAQTRSTTFKEKKKASSIYNQFFVSSNYHKSGW